MSLAFKRPTSTSNSADGLTAVQRRAQEKNRLNNPQDELFREAVKGQLGFDPSTVQKTQQALFEDNIVNQSLFVNASIQELEKNGEKFCNVSHGSLAPKAIVKSYVGMDLSKIIQPDEIVFDATNKPCRKVFTQIRAIHERNDLPVPVGGRFYGFKCNTSTSSPYSNEMFDIVLEPHTVGQSMNTSVYELPFSNEGILKLVQDWGHVTREKIEACYHSKGETHDVKHGSFVHTVMTDPMFKHELTPEKYSTYTHQTTGEPVHIITPEISQKVTTYIDNELQNAPFYTPNKIGIKWSRADGLPWSSNMLGGPNGVAISDFSNRGAPGDALTETSHFGVKLAITYKLIPIVYN